MRDAPAEQHARPTPPQLGAFPMRSEGKVSLPATSHKNKIPEARVTLRSGKELAQSVEVFRFADFAGCIIVR